MNTHVLLTHSGENYYITSDQARSAADMRDQNKSIEFSNYPGRFIMPSEVKAISPTKLSSSDASSIMSGGFEQAGKYLQDYQATKPSRADVVRQEIRDNLRKHSNGNYEARNYIATNRLAKLLHPDTVKDWHMDDWDAFIAVHPNPEEELIAVETSRTIEIS